MDTSPGQTEGSAPPVAADGPVGTGWSTGGRMRRLPTTTFTAAIVAMAAVLVACAPAPAGPGTTTTTTVLTGTAPVVTSFTTPVASVTTPALVPFSWTVADPQGTPLTCTLDVEDDGDVELTVPGCQGTRSRNLTVGTTGPIVVRLTVDDGSETTSATVAFSAAPGPTETYDVVLRPQSPLSPEAQTAFDAAEARWESVLVAGVPSASVSIGTNACGATNGALSGVVDDVVIDISTTAIDGDGGILARAGPCLIATVDGLARFGVMEFDLADIGDLFAGGTLDDVIVHEMGHVLGIGTLWDSVPTGSLITGVGTGDPRFLGARAGAEWSALGRTGTVPVEATGGPGTADSHWRESVFGNELMTGFINAGSNPLSRLTIASLADLGYLVDLGAADAYSLPGGSLLSALRAPPVEFRSDLLGPVGAV